MTAADVASQKAFMSIFYNYLWKMEVVGIKCCGAHILQEGRLLQGLMCTARAHVHCKGNS